jgi:hypothetical protein
VHAAAETDGGVLIVDVWESDAHMDTFERERLFPALARLRVTGAVERDRPTRHEAFEFVAVERAG